MLPHNTTPTSVLAAAKAQPAAQSKCERLLSEIASNRGATSFELVNLTGWPKATVTARLADLQRCGAIRPQPLPLYEDEFVTRYCPQTKAAHTVYEVTGKPFKKMPTPTPLKEQLRRYKAYYEAIEGNRYFAMREAEKLIKEIVE